MVGWCCAESVELIGTATLNARCGDSVVDGLRSGNLKECPRDDRRRGRIPRTVAVILAAAIFSVPAVTCYSQRSCRQCITRTLCQLYCSFIHPSRSCWVAENARAGIEPDCAVGGRRPNRSSNLDHGNSVDGAMNYNGLVSGDYGCFAQGCLILLKRLAQELGSRWLLRTWSANGDVSRAQRKQ